MGSFGGPFAQPLMRLLGLFMLPGVRLIGNQLDYQVQRALALGVSRAAENWDRLHQLFANRRISEITFFKII